MMRYRANLLPRFVAFHFTETLHTRLARLNITRPLARTKIVLKNEFA